MNGKTALEQLEYWIEQYYRINGTPTLDDIKGQINLLKDYEREQLNLALVSPSGIDKPPLGLKPKWIHDQQRQSEIMAAINRYLEAGKTPPKEWVIEFASYCS